MVHSVQMEKQMLQFSFSLFSRSLPLDTIYIVIPQEFESIRFLVQSIQRRRGIIFSKYHLNGIHFTAARENECVQFNSVPYIYHDDLIPISIL